MKGSYNDAALQAFETGVRYQIYHALALLACAALQQRGYRTGWAPLCFVAGVVLFSGSLYGLALLEARWLGPVTPIGGVAFLIGWLLLVFAAKPGPPEA
jgi:uncharacterized membrane protein YgdD (TMEM256/DUF423 family)